MRRPARIAARIAVFALIGAAATVLVAWGCTICFEPHSTRTRVVLLRAEPDQEIHCEGWESFGGRGYRAEALLWSGLFSPPTTGLPTPALVSPPLPLWARSLEDCALVRLVEARGWPALAMLADREQDLHEGEYLAIQHQTHAMRYEGRVVLLPLRPIWPGFAVDSAFYGGLAFLVWSAPGFVRRRVRRRRGRCLRCGYELAGASICPECGGTPDAT